MVERHLGKMKAAGPIPASGSRSFGHVLGTCVENDQNAPWHSRATGLALLFLPLLLQQLSEQAEDISRSYFAFFKSETYGLNCALSFFFLEHFDLARFLPRACYHAGMSESIDIRLPSNPDSPPWNPDPELTAAFEAENIPGSAEKIAEIIIGKQRNGPTDTIKLVFLPEYARFENTADLHRQPSPF